MSDALVWFKRDLRLHDHAALDAACRYAAGGSVRCLYVAEPALWTLPDASAAQWGFVRESLLELAAALRARGVELTVWHGDVTSALAACWHARPFSALFAHEETGNAFTYARDLAVAQWCAEHRVTWTERPQNGVVRRLRNRDGWHRHWQRFMSQPCLDEPPFDPRTQPAPAAGVSVEALADLIHPLGPDPSGRQRGGADGGPAASGVLSHGAVCALPRRHLFPLECDPCVFAAVALSGLGLPVRQGGGSGDRGAPRRARVASRR